MVGFQNSIYCTTSFNDVAFESASQANVIVSVHKNFQVKQPVDLLVIETEDAFEDHQRGPFAQQAWVITLACHVVVVWNGHIIACLKLR